MSKVTKSVEFSVAPILFEYDSESTIAESVRIGDTLTAFLFTLDEAHKFHSHLTDFLAQAREVPQRPLPRDFSVEKSADGFTITPVV